MQPLKKAFVSLKNPGNSHQGKDGAKARNPLTGLVSQYEYFLTADSKEEIVATPSQPPVVVTKGKVTLADHLSLKELPLATTPGGTSFALKALHPSEHSIKVARCPAGNFNSVAICSDAVHTIQSVAAGAALRIYNSPDITVPCTVLYDDGTGTMTAYNFNNAAFQGTVVTNQTAAQLHSFFKTNMQNKFELYRINSQSVTVELIAPALADQGTITSAQMPVACEDCDVFNIVSSTSVKLGPHMFVFETPPAANTYLLGTAAYTAKAREGVYQPLRLTKLGKWYNVNEPGMYFQDSNVNIDPPENYNCTSSITFPHYEDRTSVTDWSQLAVLPKMCGHNIGVTEITGLAANVAIRVRVRQVLEIACKPGSIYAPMLERPLPPDPTALKMVTEISARMADAYPASYNDLGKLKDIIMGIGKKVLPFVEPALSALSMSPGPLGTAAKVITTAVPVVKTVAAAVKERKKQQKQLPVVKKK